MTDVPEVLQHADPEERAVPPARSRGRAHVCLRPDGLRFRPYRQRAPGDRVRRAVSAAAADLWRRRTSSTPATSPTSTTRSTRARAATSPTCRFNDAIARVTAGTERQYHEDVAALGCLPPTHEPRATEHIAEMTRADRAPRRARRRLCRRGPRAVLAVRDGRAARRAALRLARAPLARRDARGRARRCRALQARPDGFRALEALEAGASRAGRARAASTRRAGRAGISNARRCR